MRGNTMLRLLMAVIGALFCTQNGYAVLDEAAGMNFSHPDRIRFDSRSLIIDGKPVFVFSGALHYFRCPRELWKDRMLKMKDAGLNCVETYLAWNLHEPDEPANPEDFSKLRDLEQIGDFIQTARDLGLYVIIRPGPYICAEVDRGGMPGWLMKYRPEGLRLGHYLRSNSPEMLAWNRHWLTAAAQVVKPHLITNLPKGSVGVILWQIENEYDWNMAGLASDVRTDVLRSLARASFDSGIDVPLFTCETMDNAFRDDALLRSHVFNTTNKYPNYDMKPLIEAIEKVADYQPEAFRGIMELQGGWFSDVGGSLSGGHNAAQISQLTLTAIERGCTMINYYMFYGGSNFGYVGAHTLTQSYDYNAPLREWGEMGDRYYAVKAIGQMLKDHGQQLIHSKPVELSIQGDHKDVSIYLRRSDDGSQFFFVRNSQEKESRSGTVRVRATDGPEQTLSYNLDNFEAKVLYVPARASDLTHGQWLPKPVDRPAVVANSAAAAPLRVVSIVKEEPGNAWRNAPAGKHLVSADIFDQRYVYYRVHFDLSDDELKSPLALSVRSEGGTDTFAARINGTEVTSSKEGDILLDNLAREGTNTAEILFENLSCPRFGAIFEQLQGITQISLVPQANRRRALDGWRFKVVSASSDDLPEVRADFDDSDWPRVSLTEPAANTPVGKSGVYRATLAVSKEQLSTGITLRFETIDDSGTLYVNGKKVGSANDWSHPWIFDITEHLHEGNNIVALLAHNDYGGGGPYKGCDVVPVGRPLDNVQVTPATTVTGEAIPADAHRRLLARYTMEFQLPDTPAAKSVPWKLHLDADANAFVTLNGHLLGRYWAVGPQRDIWLPECWLNFGPEARNVIELQARPTSDAPVGKIVKITEVRPYATKVASDAR